MNAFPKEGFKRYNAVPAAPTSAAPIPTLAPVDKPSFFLSSVDKASDFLLFVFVVCPLDNAFDNSVLSSDLFDASFSSFFCVSAAETFETSNPIS